jgi:hypothetical protein
MSDENKNVMTTITKNPLVSLIVVVVIIGAIVGMSKKADRLNEGEIAARLLPPGVGQFRAVAGDYGTIFRQDGENFHILNTKKEDPMGSWSEPTRPLYINNESGNVGMSENLSVGKSINTGANLSAGGDLILEGDNRWIFHTPDDGRKTMYVAPLKADKSDWNWGVSTQFYNNGHVIVNGPLSAGGDLILEGDNKWIFHTPDDGRKTMYVAPLKADKTDWNWDKSTQFHDNGHVIVNGPLSAGGDLLLEGDNRWVFHTPDDGRKILYVAPFKADKTDWNWGASTQFSDNGDVFVPGNINMSNGWSINTSDGQFRIKHNGVDKFLAKQ